MVGRRAPIFSFINSSLACFASCFLHVTFLIVADVRLPFGMLSGALRTCFGRHTPDLALNGLCACLSMRSGGNTGVVREEGGLGS